MEKEQTNILDNLSKKDRMHINSVVRAKVRERVNEEINSATFMHLKRKIDLLERQVKSLDVAYKEIMKALGAHKVGFRSVEK